MVHRMVPWRGYLGGSDSRVDVILRRIGPRSQERSNHLRTSQRAHGREATRQRKDLVALSYGRCVSRVLHGGVRRAHVRSWHVQLAGRAGENPDRNRELWPNWHSFAKFILNVGYYLLVGPGALRALTDLGCHRLLSMIALAHR